MRNILYSCLILISNITLTIAQKSTQSNFELQKLSNEIKFDGIVEHDEWQNITPLPMASHWPEFNNEPNLKTEIYVGYDENFLYMASICYDDPALIQSQTFERDILGMTTDHVLLTLDPYNDNENAQFFAVTPTGSRIDASVRNDAIGDFPIDLSWNSFWEAKVSKFEKGWMVEMKIPFSSLRFQPDEGKVIMGMSAYRYVARKRLMDIYPQIPPNWGFWSFLKPSMANDTELKISDNKRPWFTTPYLLANTGYHHNYGESNEAPAQINDNKISAGLDVQHAITDNLNLDLSLNTDFAQVEADDQVVNLSRFSLFFPEKRRFFLERSSVMDFRFENDNRLFYSRKIGINDGRIIPLWGGARVVGRVGDFDVGMMSMQSRSFESFDSENFSILRLRKKISKNNSYVGGILTNRTDLNGSTQTAYGVDGIINVKGNDYLQINLVNSFNTDDDMSYANLFEDRKRIYLRWENRSQVGFNYILSYSQADEFYQPSMGFEERTNFKAIGDQIGYGWFPQNSEKMRYVRLDLQTKAFFTAGTNKLESFLIAPSINLDWIKTNTLMISYNYFYDKVPTSFNLSDDISIPSATYTNQNLEIVYETPRVNLINAQISTTAGSFYDGRRISLGVTPTYIISKYITLGGFYQYNRIGFDTGIYNAHVGRLKISSSFNVKLSINAFIQMNSLTKTNAINVRLRYNSKDGNDIYVVFNELLNGQGIKNELIPFSEYRGLTFKYIHTFHL